MTALGVRYVDIAGEEDAFVPRCLTNGANPTTLPLKPGNFGAENLLVRATHVAGATR